MALLGSGSTSQSTSGAWLTGPAADRPRPHRRRKPAGGARRNLADEDGEPSSTRQPSSSHHAGVNLHAQRPGGRQVAHIAIVHQCCDVMARLCRFTRHLRCTLVGSLPPLRGCVSEFASSAAF